MARFITGVLALLLAGSTLAATTPAPLSNAEIEAAKRTAAATTGSLTNKTFQVGADGRPVLDAAGKAQTQATSVGGMHDNLRMFQGYTGVAGAQQLSSPGNSSSGRVALNVNATFDFSCPLRSPSLQAAGGLVFSIDSCDPTQGAALRVCEKGSSGGTCATTQDFSAPARLPPGVYSQMAGMQLGLGCNTSGACRITVKGTYTLGGNDAQIKQQAQAAGQAADSNSMIGILRDATTKGDYAGKMQEIGRPLKACADRNSQLAGTGTAETCDGQQQVTLSTTQNSAKCEGVRQCLKEASSVQTFTRTCTRTFPLTERITRYQYSGATTCNVVNDLEGPHGDSDSCKLADGTDLRAGKTKVGNTSVECTKERQRGDDTVCTEKSWTEYWVDTSSGKMTAQFGSPSAVTGSCDTNPNSDTRITSCSGDTWFGRVLPASQCSVQVYDEATGKVVLADEVTYAQKAGCGFCMTPQVGETCYGAPSEYDEEDSCENAKLEGCTFRSAQPLTYSGEGRGLVSSQEETYECRTERKTCVQWGYGAGDNACMSSDMTLGLDTVRTGPSVADGSLNNALVAAAVLDSTAQGVEGKQNQTVPKIFSGSDLRCKRPTGGLGSLLQRNCCRTDLQRPKKGNIIRGGCSLDEAKLAAARRSHYAVYIGDYCSREINLIFSKKCVERTQTYCVFPGILPRLVQQQGRTQLAQMVGSSSGSDIKRGPLQFKYYDSGAGSWSPEVLLNGVRMRAWQWPSYCASPEKAAEQLLVDPLSKECPGIVSSWVAACDNVAGCGSLPAEPKEGSTTWSMQVVDPLVNQTSAVSRYSTVSGACSPSTNVCTYTASAWPAGKGGKAIVAKDMTWALFSEEALTNPSIAPNLYTANNVGDLMFRGFSTPGTVGGSLPAGVRLDYSRDGGQTWQSVQLSTNLRTQEATLGTSDIKVTGFCDANTNMCAYRFTGTTTVTAKPWGGARGPDCSGFTAGQLSALNFGKMDLSEWLDSVMDKVKTQSQTELVAQASAQFKEYNSIFSGGSGSTTASSPTSVNFARVVPAEGFGPFNATLVVSGFWPETTGDPALDKDKVTSVIADWGDCSAPQTLSPIPANEGVGFRAVHTYAEPSNDKHACIGSPTRNVTHKVKLTVYTTLSGAQTRVVKVENAWASFPGANNNNDNVGSTVTVPVNTGTPLPPKP